MNSRAVLLAMFIAMLFALALLLTILVPSSHWQPWVQLIIGFAFIVTAAWSLVRLYTRVRSGAKIKNFAKPKPYIFVVSGFAVIGASFFWFFFFPELLPHVGLLGSWIYIILFFLGIGVGGFLVARALMPRR